MVPPPEILYPPLAEQSAMEELANLKQPALIKPMKKNEKWVSALC